MVIQDSLISIVLISISIFSWMIYIILSFGLGIYTLIKICKRVKKDNLSKLQKYNVFTWGITYILLGFSFLFFILWYFFIQEIKLKEILDQLFVLFFNLAILIKIFNTEYTINKYKYYKGYYFSVILVILTIFSLILTPPIIRETALYQTIYLILFISGVSIYLLLFSVVAAKTKGEERITAIKFIIFPFLVVLGIVFLPVNVEVYYKNLLDYYFPYLLSPILMIIGMLLMYSTYRRNFQ
ncbi:MAG: hypothetical protein ACTSPW_06600 [Promethearchaeota archaeon]